MALWLALKSGSLNALKVLFDARSPGYDEMPNPAMHEINPQRTVWTQGVSHAAELGYVDCIAFVVSHGCPWYPEVRCSNPRIYVNVAS
jgi:hypothetical protein